MDLTETPTHSSAWMVGVAEYAAGAGICRTKGDGVGRAVTMPLAKKTLKTECSTAPAHFG